MNLTDNHYKILTSLANVKKHNSNKSNIRAALQVHMYSKDDLKLLTDHKLIRFTMMNEYQITDSGERVLKDRL